MTSSGILGSNFDFGPLAAVDPNGDTAITFEIVNSLGNPTTNTKVEIVGDAQTGFRIALKNGVTLNSSNPQGRNFSFNIMATDQAGAHSAIQAINLSGNNNGSMPPGTINVGGATALTISELGIAGRRDNSEFCRRRTRTGFRRFPTRSWIKVARL